MEVHNYWLQWLLGRQLSFALCFIKQWVLHEDLIWGPSNIPALSFSILIRGNFSWRKQISYFPCEMPLPSSSVFLTWYVSVEAVFCLVQQEGETECYASQVLTLVLTVTLVCLSQRYWKQWYFVYPPWSPRTSQTALRTLQINHMCSWYLTADSKWSMLLWVSFIWTECLIGTDENYSHYVEQLWDFCWMSQ